MYCGVRPAVLSVKAVLRSSRCLMENAVSFAVWQLPEPGRLSSDRCDRCQKLQEHPTPEESSIQGTFLLSFKRLSVNVLLWFSLS